MFEKKYRLNLIKIHPKTHQVAPFKNIFSGGGGGASPRTPLAMHLASQI